MRYAEIKRCSPKDCPYCLQSQHKETIYYCHAWKKPLRMRKVKTFPQSCPLKTKIDLATDIYELQKIT